MTPEAEKQRLAVPARFQRRFHIDDRCPIDRLEAPDVDAGAVDVEDRHRVNAERIRPVLRPRGEHAPHGPARIAARMHSQDGPVRQVQPRDDDDVVAGPQPVERCTDAGLECQPAVRRALVALTGGTGWIVYGRFDPPDGY